MNKQTVYRQLESKMLSYIDYANVPVEPIGEPLVPIRASRSLTARQIDSSMLPYTGETLYVRAGVLKRLKAAGKTLARYDPTLLLEVVYGYRALEIQTGLFEKYKTKLQNRYSGGELLAAVHRLVAVPEVAGHPAGAAVDIQILQAGKPIDFGTEIHQFVPDSFTFSPFVSSEAWRNRQLLRRAMMLAGFAPFDGEWWHFSYGDKEWARYYNQRAALYEQIDWQSAPIVG